MKKSKNGKDEKYPDYQHYGRKEDIYTNAEEVSTDPEHVNSDNKTSLNKTKIDGDPVELNESPLELLTDEEEITRSENEITPEDMIALGEMDEDNDGGEDELLKQSRIYPIDMEGKDLDIPNDDINEIEGEEDEENQLYSFPDN